MSDKSALAGALDVLRALDAEDDRFEEFSRQLVNNLFVLLRSAGLYDLKNDAMHRPFAAMISTVRTLLQFGDQVELSLRDQNFFVNRRLVKLDAGTYQNAGYLRRIFGFLDINQIQFTAELDDATITLFVEGFLEVLAEAGDSPITAYPLGSIRVRKLDFSEDEAHRASADPRQAILAIYASGLLMLRQFVNDLRQGRSPRHAKVKRLCLQIIDVEPRLHNVLLSLVHLEGYKGNLFSHMLNTAVLSVVFGHRLGMNRNQLLDLGMAAFNHDLGWALLGTLDGQAADAQLDMEGIADIRDHQPQMMAQRRVQVARALVQLGGFNEMVINRLIVAFECQVPETARPEGLYVADIGPSFMTEVVRMASTYDELTCPRTGRPALLPDEAMRRILDDGGQTFDVFLAKLFANSIGCYPVGTLVELDSGEIGLVINLPSDPINFHRPQVKLLIDRAGEPLRDGDCVDLNARLPNGKFTRTIARTLDSRAYGVSITRFFFGADGDAKAA